MWNDKRIALLGVQDQCRTVGDHLIEKGYGISCVITVKSSPSVAGWVDLAAWGAARGLPVYLAQSYSLKRDLGHFSEACYDLGILLGWQRLVPGEIIRAFRHGIIGQHGSAYRLPKGRGRSTINWSLIEGRKRLFWHLFSVAPGVDDGDVLDFFEFDITEHDSCKTVYDKLGFVLRAMLDRTLPRILDGTIQGEKQVGEPTFYRKRSPDDGWIDWNADCERIYDLVRALTRPYPGARAKLRGKDWLIWRCSIWSRELQSLFPDAACGDVATETDDGVVVRCRDGMILIESMDMEPLAS